MKKNILKVTLVAAFALAAGYNVYTSQKSSDVMSDLAMANVEALAFFENDPVKFPCKEKKEATCRFEAALEDGLTGIVEIKGAENSKN